MGIEKLVAAMVEAHAVVEVTAADVRGIVQAAHCDVVPVDASAWLHALAFADPRGIAYETEAAHERLATSVVARCRMVQSQLGGRALLVFDGRLKVLQ
jgi:hypothetical protein